MISSPNKVIRFILAGALFATGFFAVSSSVAQEKPRSLVPSVQEKTTTPEQPSLTEENPASVFEGPALETLTDERAGPDGENGTNSFVVEKLEALNPSSIGTLSEAEGGFGPGMWNGTSAQLAATLLDRVSFGANSPQMLDLYRRLLLTGAVLSGSKSDQILDIRFKKLRDAGQYQDVSSLIARLPKSAILAKHEKLLVELDLLAGRDEDACGKSGRHSKADLQTSFWSKIAVYCRLLAEDFDRAELGAALLEEQGEKDPLYFALFAKLAGDPSPVATSAVVFRPLHLAMTRQAKVILDPGTVETSSPEILNALVRSPEILGEEGAFTIFKAARNDPLDGNALRLGFINSVKSDEDKSETDKPEPDLYSQYAMLLQAATVATADAEKAISLEALFVLAAENGHFQTVSKLALDEIIKLKPDNYGREFNFSVVKSLLLHGHKDKAPAWERVIRRAASQGTPAERLAKRGDVTRLDAYMLLSGASAIARWNGASFSAWTNATDLDPDQGYKSELLLSMLEVFGYSVVPLDWQELLSMNVPLSKSVSSHALEVNLIASAQNRRRGETVALALQALGKDGPSGASTTTLVAVTTALKAVGFEEEARNLAIEVLVAKGF